MNAEAWFAGWPVLFRTVLVGAAAYVTLVVLLRVSGKRTLSKLNAFDLVVTVALGSTLATVLVSKDVAFTQGAVAFAVLVGLQFVVTWLEVRSGRVRSLVKTRPRLIFYRGEFQPAALRRERVTENEVLAAARSQGLASLDDVEAVVLESDGTIAVVRSAPSGRPSTLRNVGGYAGEDAAG